MKTYIPLYRAGLFLFCFVMVCSGYTKYVLPDNDQNSSHRMEEDSVYTEVEEMPVFPGGDMELWNYIKQHLSYPVFGDVDIQGRVIISFVVEKDGQITNEKIIRGLDGRYGYNENALKVVREMPRWIPGKIGEKPVRTRYTIPIHYVVNPNTY